MSGPMRFLVAVLAGAGFCVLAVWLCVRAAGTNWALPVFVVLFAAGYLGDSFVEGRRRARLTRLFRFEEREADRRRAA